MKVGEKLMVRMDPPFSITWLVNGLSAICHVPRIDNLTSGKYIVYGHYSKNCNFLYTFEIIIGFTIKSKNINMLSPGNYKVTINNLFKNVKKIIIF